MDELIQSNEARVNVTYAGQNGELPDPVQYDSTDGDVKGWVSEAVAGGNIPGIPATANPDFSEFVVERYPASDDRPHNLIMLRPKTPFGS